MALYRGSGTPVAGYGVISGREEHTATADQTVFTLTSLSTSGVHVYVSGVRQSHSAYTETDSTTITFSEGLNVGDKVLFEQVG